jgi:hypothetical protein
MQKINDEVRTKSATFSIIEEGFLRIKILEGSEIDLAESKISHKVSLEITGFKKFVTLIDARATVVVSKEAREWGSSPEAQENMFAQAILVNSIANRLIGNFIIQFYKPIAKTKLFSDELTALTWLKEQKKILLKES